MESLVKHLAESTAAVLASADGGWKFEHSYALKPQLKGGHLTGFVDGRQLAGGGSAFNQQSSSIFLHFDHGWKTIPPYDGMVHRSMRRQFLGLLIGLLSVLIL